MATTKREGVIAGGMLAALAVLDVTPGAGKAGVLLFGLALAKADPDLANEALGFALSRLKEAGTAPTVVVVLEEGAPELAAAIRADLDAAEKAEEEGMRLIRELGLTGLLGRGDA